jgi:hypothetical protein
MHSHSRRLAKSDRFVMEVATCGSYKLCREAIRFTAYAKSLRRAATYLRQKRRLSSRDHHNLTSLSA